MEKVTVTAADAKKRFFEYIDRDAFSDCRMIITRQNRPVAAIVSMKDLQRLERNDERKGLLSMMDAWRDFDEIEDAIDQAVDSRHAEGTGRDVSL